MIQGIWGQPMFQDQWHDSDSAYLMPDRSRSKYNEVPVEQIVILYVTTILINETNTVNYTNDTFLKLNGLHGPFECLSDASIVATIKLQRA